MSIRGDSYSSVAEVLAFTRHLLGGEPTFNSETRPTVTEVEKFIDRASAMLNMAMEQAGLSTPVTNSTGKLACDDWVTQRSAEYVELTQRGVGFNDQEGSRTASFRNLAGSAKQFVEENVLGLKYLGVTVAHGLAEGLVFTGMDAQADRADPDNDAKQQPAFTRGMFDNTEGDE